jgi:hypothetical protein
VTPSFNIWTKILLGFEVSKKMLSLGLSCPHQGSDDGGSKKPLKRWQIYTSLHGTTTRRQPSKVLLEFFKLYFNLSSQ